jgi:hypothetical protein
VTETVTAIAFELAVTLLTLGAGATLVAASKVRHLNKLKDPGSQFNGKLDIGGQQYNVKNGQGQPGYSLYQDPNVKAGAVSHSHAEGHAAAIIRQSGAKEGTITINNPNGPCGYCDKVIENMLPKDSKLTVNWPGGSHTFTGNAK